jgi:serine/threonine protein kinase
MSHPSVGQALGDYFLQEELGRGGMGAVYKAHQTSLDRIVALKVLLPFLEPETSARRFEREGRIHAKLSHPCLVRVYDVGHVGDIPYIAMELLEGPTLRQLINKYAPMRPRRALDHIRSVLQGVEYLHAQGLLHRDIKPANVLGTPALSLKLADFGLCWERDTTRITQGDGIVGTLSYMAPELFRGSKPDPSADLYAVGVMLYECLTRAYPFPHDGPAALMERIQGGDPVPPSRIVPALSASLETFVLRLVSSEPEYRPDATTALQHVEAFLAEPSSSIQRPSRTVSLHPPQGTAPISAASAREPRRWWRGALAVLGLAAALGVSWIRPHLMPPGPAPSVTTARPAPGASSVARLNSAAHALAEWLQRPAAARADELPAAATALLKELEQFPPVGEYSTLLPDLRRIISLSIFYHLHANNQRGQFQHILNADPLRPRAASLTQCFLTAWQIALTPDTSFLNTASMAKIMQKITDLSPHLKGSRQMARLASDALLWRAAVILRAESEPVPLPNNNERRLTRAEGAHIVLNMRNGARLIASALALRLRGFPVDAPVLTELSGYAYGHLIRIPNSLLSSDSNLLQFLGEGGARSIGQDVAVTMAWVELTDAFLQTFLALVADASAWPPATAARMASYFPALNLIREKLQAFWKRGVTPIPGQIKSICENFDTQIKETPPGTSGDLYRLTRWYWRTGGFQWDDASILELKDLSRRLGTRHAPLKNIHRITVNVVKNRTTHSWNETARRLLVSPL